MSSRPMACARPSPRSEGKRDESNGAIPAYGLSATSVATSIQLSSVTSSTSPTPKSPAMASSLQPDTKNRPNEVCWNGTDASKAQTAPASAGSARRHGHVVVEKGGGRRLRRWTSPARPSKPSHRRTPSCRPPMRPRARAGRSRASLSRRRRRSNRRRCGRTLPRTGPRRIRPRARREEAALLRARRAGRPCPLWQEAPGRARPAGRPPRSGCIRRPGCIRPSPFP